MQAEEPTPLTWQGGDDGPHPTSYEVLQVHPSAPLELITGVYWRLAGQAQTRRAFDKAAEADLHVLTLAYQTLTNPELRAAYDRSIGVVEESLPPDTAPARTRGLFGKGKRELGTELRLDYYEILRIVPEAEPAIVEEAYSSLRTYYVRLVQNGYSSIELLDYLEEAYGVVSDPERRARYDSERLPGAVASRPSVATPVADASPVAAIPKAPERPKLAVVPARPRITEVRVPASAQPAHQPGSPLAAISGAFGAIGRQFGTMFQREQRQVDERFAASQHERADGSEIEAELLHRIALTVEAPPVAAPAATVPRAVARVTVIDGPRSGEAFEIRSFPLTLGGNPECDIMLPGLASEQARLLFRDGRFVVYNLAPPEPGATGEAEPWWIVESGDDLAVGTYKLRFTAIHD